MNNSTLTDSKELEEYSSIVVAFNRLPDNSLITIKVLMLIAQRSRSSIMKDVAAGYLPAPIKWGERRLRWLAGDVRKALAK